MAKDRSERRAYRKSPGRQYGYDYDPLRGQNRDSYSSSGRLDTSASSERWTTHGETTSRSGPSRPSVELAQRPDPRRTRQLLRQNILASKAKSALQTRDTEEQEDDLHTSTDNDKNAYEDSKDSTLYRNRYPARMNRSVQPLPPQQFADTDEVEEGEWNELDFVDPDIGYEDPFDRRLSYSEAPQLRSPAHRASPHHPQSGFLPLKTSDRGEHREYAEDEYADEQDQRSARRRGKKQGVSRRKLLWWGLGLAGAGVAAYELVPKVPQAISDVGTNIEHQVQDAFNRGFGAGADAVRKEFINALDDLEGVSLGSAMQAAHLTRIAYDVFVSPLVTLAATVAGDFLNATLRALINGRKWLQNIGQDNSTLQALQTVLETWVNQVTNMPKQIQSITDADLDGAQAYLRALQRKIQAEQAKLNGQNTISAPSPTPTRKP